MYHLSPAICMHNVSPHVFVSLCHKFKVILWQQNYERFLRNCIDCRCTSSLFETVTMRNGKVLHYNMGQRETLKLCNTKTIMPVPSSIPHYSALVVALLQLFIAAFICMDSLHPFVLKKKKQRKVREKLDRFLWFFSKVCKQASVQYFPPPARAGISCWNTDKICHLIWPFGMKMKQGRGGKCQTKLSD